MRITWFLNYLNLLRMKTRPGIVVIGLSFICFLLVSCGSKDQSESYLQKKLVNVSDINTYKYAVILPSLGCQGCISTVEEFIKNNINRTEVLFILTRIESLKMLQNKIGIDVNKHSNVLIDLENKFLITSDNSIYPIVLELEESTIKSLYYISPKADKSLIDIITTHD